MPKDLESVKDFQNIFVSDEYIYFVRLGKLERLHIEKNELCSVKLNQ